LQGQSEVITDCIQTAKNT